MARIRTIKPEFFRHVELYEAEKASGLPLRVAFSGLWTVADREGRFRWKPRVLVLDVLPFDEVDFSAVLDALAEWGFIVKYQVGADTFGCIPSFPQHQHVNQREPASSIPSPDDACARTCANIPAHGEGKGRGQEGKQNNAPSQASGAVLADPPPEEKARYSEEFEILWSAYRPIAAKNATKADAATAFNRLGWADREACTEGTRRYAEWLLAERRKRPDTPAKHLATFIHKRGWEPFLDEAATSAPAVNGTTWITEDDPRWEAVAARYGAERGKPLHASGSQRRPGQGADVPSDWLVPH